MCEPYTRLHTRFRLKIIGKERGEGKKKALAWLPIRTSKWLDRYRLELRFAITVRMIPEKGEKKGVGRFNPAVVPDDRLQHPGFPQIDAERAGGREKRRAARRPCPAAVRRYGRPLFFPGTRTGGVRGGGKEKKGKKKKTLSSTPGTTFLNVANDSD